MLFLNHDNINALKSQLKAIASKNVSVLHVFNLLAVNQEEQETVGGGSKSSEDSQDRSRPEPLGRPPPALPEGAVTKAQERPSLPPLPVNRREQPAAAAAANTGTGKVRVMVLLGPVQMSCYCSATVVPN